jgi:anti-sigma factor RsiW
VNDDDVRCRQVVELLADYLEGALDPALAGPVREHLAACDPCTVFLAQLEVTIGLVGQLPAPGALDPAVRAALLREFRGVLG